MIMKDIKHLLFLSILCSLVLFTNCGDSDDPVADDNSTAVLDADGDGVADADDTCEDTPSGETVDSSGCSDSQKDSDGDGVSDNLDTCADTPESAKVDENGCEVVTSSFIYLDENGVTIKASENALIGESYVLDGVSYLIVDSTMLYQMINDSLDVTKIITSFVTDMSYMFPSSNFNQDISHWDISNVKNMRVMFYYNSSFNQDISHWDVSEVTDMGDMLASASSFNQDLSAWDVDKVTFCNDFSANSTAWTDPKPNFTNCTE